ncbi:MAG TPA: hypothetical protein VF395_19655 [Polyangiaceae bacterium]
MLAPADLSGNAPCIAAKLREVQRLHLTEAVHGLRGELVVLMDSRMKRETLDSNGYVPGVTQYEVGPAQDSLLAASAVQLRTTQGAVLSELTLFPAVDVAARKLGSGTDTFLATEHFGCGAGRWCGWHTVFFEIRNQRLLRLSAEGVGGQREVEATASFAARWMLTPAARVGARDIIVQREDPDRDPSVLFVETHFSFSGGSWRFSEREVARDDKASRQVGQWLGSLDY